ncbi:MAG TPA: hypothetical protein VGM03_21460 [Phycisphaerae bacterium]|jgi:hypothetical protein
MRNWLRHAFAVEPPGPAEPDDAERAAVDRIVLEIGRRGLITPALLFLETGRNLNYVGAALLHYVGPFATALLNPQHYQAFATFLERRGSIDYLCGRLESWRAEPDAPEAPRP